MRSKCAYAFHIKESSYKREVIDGNKYKNTLRKEEKLEADVLLTVRNMTNSQKRKLYKLMCTSGIRENSL